MPDQQCGERAKKERLSSEELGQVVPGIEKSRRKRDELVECDYAGDVRGVQSPLIGVRQ
jgi:hypothetical protein